MTLNALRWRQVTVSTSASPSVRERQSRMQPRQNAWLQSSRPNLRSEASGFDRTCAQQLPAFRPHFPLSMTLTQRMYCHASPATEDTTGCHVEKVAQCHCIPAPCRCST